MGRQKEAAEEISALPVNGEWSEEYCRHCPWLEWDLKAGRCHNRGEFICRLHLSEVFSGDR